MSPTLLEIAVGLLAAALIFLWALRVAPPLIETLAEYLRQTVTGKDHPSKNGHNHDHES